MEKITGASNRIDEIMKEQADMYRPKTDEEIAAKFERQNKEAAERLRKKMKNEPEDKADGGRAGYGLGSLIQPAKANQNQNTSGVDPRMNLDYDTLVEQNVDKRLQDPNFLNNIQGVKPPLEKLYPVEPGKDEEFITQPGFPDRDGDGLDDRLKKLPYTGKNYGPGNQPYTAVMPQEGMRYVYDEQGTRYSVPNTQPTSLEDYLSGYEQYKSNNPNKYVGTQALIDATLPGGFDYTFSSGAHANHFNDYLESLGLSPYQKNLTTTMIEKLRPEDETMVNQFKPEDMAKGGRAGFYTGGITDVEPSLDDIGHGSDSLMSRTRLMSPGAQATTSTGLNYLLAEDNDNLRIPFSKGKLAKEIVDKGRRGFMKAAGATGAGIAALKTGLLGYGEKAAPVVETAVETVKETAKGVPPYFYRLVEKIRAMGDETVASQDKVIAKKYKDYVMEEDFAGNITIVKSGEDLQGNKLEDVYMSYKVDDVALKDKDGFARAEDYEEFTARPDAEGKMKDVEQGVPDEVIEEAGDIDAMTLKKADGGRIGFSKGKLVFENAKKFLEKIFGKENMAEMPNRDPEMYQGMLEVVDMFRKRDKEGLKKYLQKFLPHMDDAQVEDFIVGDAEDMAGLQKFGLGNLQGQLIRLGSGRDYAGKIEAVKKLERNKSLKDLEVTEDMQRKPNASGGLTTMLGE